MLVFSDFLQPLVRFLSVSQKYKIQTCDTYLNKETNTTLLLFIISADHTCFSVIGYKTSEISKTTATFYLSFLTEEGRATFYLYLKRKRKPLLLVCRTPYLTNHIHLGGVWIAYTYGVV